MSSAAEETKTISAAASVSDEPTTPPPDRALYAQEDTGSSPNVAGSVAPILDEQSRQLKLEDEQYASPSTKDEAPLVDTEMKKEPAETINQASESTDIAQQSREKGPTSSDGATQGIDSVQPLESAVGRSEAEKVTSIPFSADVEGVNRREESKADDAIDSNSAMASKSRPSTAEQAPSEAIPAAKDARSLQVSMGAEHAPNAPNGFNAASANSSQAAAKRNAALQPSAETQQRARVEESSRIQRENEDMRLQWLSLPANDHITYYSDTEDDAASDPSDAMTMGPAGVFGGMPYLSAFNSKYSNHRKRNRETFQDERESSDSDDEKIDQEALREEHQYRNGNRGNKLLKSSRWIRRGKLGVWTEAKTEKDYHDRFMSRVKAIQRAGVESLLHNAPGPKIIKEDGSLSRDMLEGSDRLLLRDTRRPIEMEENLYSTSLAPALLRPILSAKALLESHTLRHTFRNPHIGALSKTALDLRESESQLAKALGRCFAVMERTNAYFDEPETGQVRVNGSQSTDDEIDVHIIGAENTTGTADEVNPALYRLEDLFITKKGLPIPVSTGSDNESQGNGDSQAVLSTTDQRNVVRAALECLTDLAADSLEYVERLEEVRGRLESVKRQRSQVWQALRLWAIKREFGESEEEEEIVEEVNGVETISNRAINKPGTAATSATMANRRRR